jgi:hypothetical protein
VGNPVIPLRPVRCLRSFQVLTVLAFLSSCGKTDWGAKSERVGRDAGLMIQVSPAAAVVGICDDGTTKDEQVLSPSDEITIDMVVFIERLAKSIDKEFGSCANLNDHLDLDRLDKGWREMRSLLESVGDSSSVPAGIASTDSVPPDGPSKKEVQRLVKIVNNSVVRKGLPGYPKPFFESLDTGELIEFPDGSNLSHLLQVRWHVDDDRVSTFQSWVSAIRADEWNVFNARCDGVDWIVSGTKFGEPRLVISVSIGPKVVGLSIKSFEVGTVATSVPPAYLDELCPPFPPRNGA